MTPKTIKMPILWAYPTTSIDGRKIQQEQINDLLKFYDAKVRPARLIINENDAHKNGPALGTVSRVYRVGDLIFADISPSRGFEETLSALTAPDGSYPDRSCAIEKIFLPDGRRVWNLESIALLGAERPALNLPPVQYSANHTRVCFTYDSAAFESGILAPTAQKPTVHQRKQEAFTGTVVTWQELDRMKMSAIRRVASELRLDTRTPAGMDSAYATAYRRNPDLFRQRGPDMEDGRFTVKSLT